ncbi:MAG TPA: TPM domain-containing protein [Pseudomonas sp.]|jgi:putative membrane protein|nr:TPM domain-containing protein [Pseudomonas sp.]
MSLLNAQEQQQVAEAIARVERDTDAELVTVLAAQADDYRYITLLWAGLLALLLPGLFNLFGDWWSARQLLLAQWLGFVVLALLFGLPFLRVRLTPRVVRHWRAANLARRQFLEQKLHHTEGDVGMLIFVSEAEHYVEILVDRGIASRIDDAAWQAQVDRFTRRVRQGQVLQGFLDCIEGCGAVLREQLPATHPHNQLADRLIILP